MESKSMAQTISKNIRSELAKYFVRGFDGRDLLILIPTKFFDILVGYMENEINFACENPSDSTDTKTYIFGIETKRVNDLDYIYVSLK